MTGRHHGITHRARRTTAALIVSAAVLVAVGGAAAARVETTEVLAIGVLSIVASAGETNRITVTPVSGDPNRSQIEDAAVQLDIGPGCERVLFAPPRARCQRAGRATINLGDGDDELFYSYSVFATIDGGPGRDILHAGPQNDTVNGGPGDDVMSGGPGADVFNGGEGDADIVDFTPQEAFGTGPAVPVTATIDGAANDGASGEGDNVRTDVEGLVGGGASDRLTGNTAANALRGSGGGDTLLGLAGDDDINGGEGGDDIDGGPGRDRLDGSSGNDRIDARDRVGDTIDCGSGIDVVHLDLADTFAGCEAADFGPAAQVGLFRLRPSRTRARAGRPVTLTLTWTTPLRWRDLRSVDLRLRSGARSVGVMRFREDGSPTGTLSLGAGRGTPGQSRTLRRGPLSLLLARSTVAGSGPTGRTVTMKLVLRFARALAGRTLRLELSATDDRGRRQPFRTAGRIAIR